MQVLIVEDQPNDLHIAARAAEASGFSSIEARSSVDAAKAWLQKGLDGEFALPDAIILDIDLGYESGFELLRYWHGQPQLARIPIVVWTILGDHYREICQMFKVSAYVDKGENISVLQQVLAGLTGLAA
ncbi:MAG: response regulator [Acidobacteriota bacterium]